MKFKLPIIEETFIEDGKVETKESYIDCELNLTIDAQQVWEETFPELAKRISLFDYVEKYKDLKITDPASLATALKMVYCFILFDREMSFREFVRMFSTANTEYLDKLYGTLASVLKAVNNRYEPKKKI